MVKMSKIRNGLTGLVTAGILSGCATFPDYNEQLRMGQITPEQYNQLVARKERIRRDEAFLLSLGGSALAGRGFQKGNPYAASIGQGMSAHGAALAGKDEVSQNVNVYTQQTPSQTNFSSQTSTQWHSELGSVITTTCNYIQDIDKDGSIGYDEIMGAKNRFSTNEQIVFYLGGSKKARFSDFELTILDNSGRKIETRLGKENELFKGREIEVYGVNNIYYPGELKEGDYTAVFFYKGHPLRKLEIDVVK